MKKFLTKLKNKENLSFIESIEAFEMLMNGKVKDDEIYNFLTFYQQKVRFLKKLQEVFRYLETKQIELM